MCIEDERVNVAQDVFLLWLLWSVDIFFQDKCWSEVPTMKELKYPSEYISFWVHGPSSKWENTPGYFGPLRNFTMCSLRDRVMLWELALHSVKGPQQKHEGFSPSSGFLFLVKMKDINTVSLLEELISALSPACTAINNEWFPSTCSIVLFRPEKSLILSLLKGDPLFKGTTLENTRSEVGWCLGHLSLHEISLVGKHGKGEAWEQWVPIKLPDFSEILGFLENTSTLWSHWK